MNKAKFILQQEVPTSTVRTVSRVQWLLGLSLLEEPFLWVIRELQINPQRQDLTPIFLNRITAENIETLLELKSPGSSQSSKRSQGLRQLKQELGMYVPVRLVSLCGATEVLTLRDGRAASPRKISIEYPNELKVQNYTPHKVTTIGIQKLITYYEKQNDDKKGFAEKIGFSGSYEEINREERNLSAILYHLLSYEKNLRALLALISYPVIAIENYSVFFEFAMLRDLWSTQVSQDNSLARRVILDYLPEAPDWLKDCSFKDFNSYWGASNPSSKHIQMPSTWSISRMNQIKDSHLLLKACYFKWSFNAKPDLVIKLSDNRAICLELKLESNIDSYPSRKDDKLVFQERGLQYVKQTTVQKYLMEELMGFSTTFVLLSKKNSTAENFNTITWQTLLEKLDVSSSPLYMRKTLSTLLAN